MIIEIIIGIILILTLGFSCSLFILSITLEITYPEADSLYKTFVTSERG